MHCAGEHTATPSGTERLCAWEPVPLPQGRLQKSSSSLEILRVGGKVFISVAAVGRFTPKYSGEQLPRKHSCLCCLHCPTKGHRRRRLVKPRSPSSAGQSSDAQCGAARRRAVCCLSCRAHHVPLVFEPRGRVSAVIPATGAASKARGHSQRVRREKRAG